MNRLLLSLGLLLPGLPLLAQVRPVALPELPLSPGFGGRVSSQLRDLERAPQEELLSLSAVAAMPQAGSPTLELERQGARLVMSLVALPPSEVERGQLSELLGPAALKSVDKAARSIAGLKRKDPAVRAALDELAEQVSRASGAKTPALLRRFYAGERILPEAVSSNPEIHPERTAMARSGPSVPTRLAESRFSGSILDYGAGRGADSRHLRSKGLDVVSYDPHYFPEKPAPGRRFDWVQLNYVLNVIPERAARDAVLKDIHGRLKPGGRFLAAVRTKAEMEAASRGKPWKRHRDGWITSGGTFQHGYTDAELSRQLSKNGFAVTEFLAPGIAIAEKMEKRSWAAALKGLPFGKKMPSAVYLHRSTLGKLPAPLAAAVRKAENSLPAGARWSLAKLALDGKSLSLLWYPDFDKNPHPALHGAYRVDLKTGAVEFTDHSARANKFILHRKETFVDASYPGHARFRRETLAEEKAGLLSRNDIGTEDGWRLAKREAADRR